MKGVKMLFAHDTEMGLAAMASLVNTGSAADGDQLTDLAGLDRFVRGWEWTGARTHDQAELTAIRALRPRLARLWEEDEAGAVHLVNALLREFGALPQLVKHDGWAYHLHATSADAPLAQRMAVDAAMAMIDVIRQDELGRLRRCAADGCSDVMVDLSKNRSRRFCDVGCANRTNVAAFRARRSDRAR
jgi:predicted RNA-binding Zn ribbon-like protein